MVNIILGSSVQKYFSVFWILIAFLKPCEPLLKECLFTYFKQAQKVPFKKPILDGSTLPSTKKTMASSTTTSSTTTDDNTNTFKQGPFYYDEYLVYNYDDQDYYDPGLLVINHPDANGFLPTPVPAPEVTTRRPASTKTARPLGM